ncbi:MAG: hypothetical protein GY794_01925 [bacterium]|nr:hypothetical protein [bacterium]
MKNAVTLILLCVLTMSATARAADGPKLVGEKEIMTLDKTIACLQRGGIRSMRLSPDGRRMLYLRKKTYKITMPNGRSYDRQGVKFVLRDLKTGKDTTLPVPAVPEKLVGAMCLSMTMFDPTGKTLVVPVGVDPNKNDLADQWSEKSKVGLYDIASGKLKTLDLEDGVVIPAYHPDGKRLIVTVIEITRSKKDIKVYVTPTDKIKFRKLSKVGLIRAISPTSDLMVMVLMTPASLRSAESVLYDIKTDTVKSELVKKGQSNVLLEYNPQWTSDGRYLYHLLVKHERSEEREYTEVLTRIWDAKASKEVGIYSSIAPIGPGPAKGTMVLVKNPPRPRSSPGTQPAIKVEPGIVLHIQGDKKLHPLGDKTMRPISTQGKWLLFVRKNADGKEKAYIAEIVLPKK